MGLFGPPKMFRIRDFTMPCTPDEAMDVLRSTPDYVQKDPLRTTSAFGDLLASYDSAGAPLRETVYVDNLRSYGFDVVAGNRARTYWRLRLSLAGSMPVRGVFEPVEVNDSSKWQGNVMQMVFALDHAVLSVGGSRGKWPEP